MKITELIGRTFNRQAEELEDKFWEIDERVISALPEKEVLITIEGYEVNHRVKGELLKGHLAVKEARFVQWFAVRAWDETKESYSHWHIRSLSHVKLPLNREVRRVYCTQILEGFLNRLEIKEPEVKIKNKPA